MTKLTKSMLVVAACVTVGCSSNNGDGDGTNNGGSTNNGGASNNGTASNNGGASNNGATNNGSATNNGASNNGTASNNGGATNNGATVGPQYCDAVDCAAETPICSNGLERCVQCLSDNDCAAGNLRTCDAFEGAGGEEPSYECVECVDDSVCGGGTCDPDTKTCM